MTTFSQSLPFMTHEKEFLKHVQNLLNSRYSYKNVLTEAMEYTSLEGGKYLRPRLVYASSYLFDVDLDTAHVAAAVECIHAYSLVHDDLPAMDNSSVRRGKASCWKKFGEATAILVGDALLTLAFEILLEAPLPASTIVSLGKVLSQASGYQGMVLGQSLDLMGKGLSQDDMWQMVDAKTGGLLRFCCCVGPIVSSTQEKHSSWIREFGTILGRTYQMIDDIKDQDHEDKNSILAFIKTEDLVNLIHQNFVKLHKYIAPFGDKGEPMMALLKEVEDLLNK